MGSDAVHVGVDLGQRQDPTAVVAVQVITSPTEQTRYLTQHMERLPLGTAYPDVAAHLVKFMAALYAMEQARIAALEAERQATIERAERERQRLIEQVRATGQQVAFNAGPLLPMQPEPEQRKPPMAARRLFVDATGVGRPVVDILERALAADPRTRGVELRPITFTHGDTYDPNTGRMGKAYLVSRLQALLQERCLRLPPLHPETDAITRELKDYEIRVDSATANDTYGAFRVGSHDDLVTALGLAVLEDPNRRGPRVRFFD